MTMLDLTHLLLSQNRPASQNAGLSTPPIKKIKECGGNILSLGNNYHSTYHCNNERLNNHMDQKNVLEHPEDIQ
jgi:hypothetical protein